jgi:hypothetical protein
MLQMILIAASLLFPIFVTCQDDEPAPPPPCIVQQETGTCV